MILHHIQNSSAQSAGLKLALRYASTDDAVLFSGDAAGSVLLTAWQTELSGKSLYFLEEDLKARGIGELIRSRYPKAQLIDYGAWVQLSLNFDKVITW